MAKLQLEKNNAHIVIVNQGLILNHLLTTDDAVFIILTTSDGDFAIGSFYAPPQRNQRSEGGFQDPFHSMMDALSHDPQRQDMFFLCGWTSMRARSSGGALKPTTEVIL